jgi:hypothetical protein
MYDLVGTEEKPRQSPQNPVPLDLHKSSTNGDVAQMVERVLSMHEAQGSIPCFSTFLSFLFVSFVFESVSNASSTRLCPFTIVYSIFMALRKKKRRFHSGKNEENKITALTVDRTRDL